MLVGVQDALPHIVEETNKRLADKVSLRRLFKEQVELEAQAGAAAAEAGAAMSSTAASVSLSRTAADLERESQETWSEERVEPEDWTSVDKELYDVIIENAVRDEPHFTSLSPLVNLGPPSRTSSDALCANRGKSVQSEYDKDLPTTTY